MGQHVIDKQPLVSTADLLYTFTHTIAYGL